MNRALSGCGFLTSSVETTSYSSVLLVPLLYLHSSLKSSFSVVRFPKTPKLLLIHFKRPRRRCSHPSSCAKCKLFILLSSTSSHVRDVEETVLVLVLFVDAAHEGGSWGKNLVDEDEDGLLGRKLNALADHVDELSNGEVAGDQMTCVATTSVWSPRRCDESGIKAYRDTGNNAPCASRSCDGVLAVTFLDRLDVRQQLTVFVDAKVRNEREDKGTCDDRYRQPPNKRQPPHKTARSTSLQLRLINYSVAVGKYHVKQWFVSEFLACSILYRNTQNPGLPALLVLIGPVIHCCRVDDWSKDIENLCEFAHAIDPIVDFSDGGDSNPLASFSSMVLGSASRSGRGGFNSGRELPSHTVARCIVPLAKAWQVVYRLVISGPRIEYNEYVAMDGDAVMLVGVGLHAQEGSHGI
ncbi:hypothetical protein KCU65_g219, partial [Aureobasidium melanogenum]